MLKSGLLALLLCLSCATWAAVPLGSAHALVVDEDSGEVLLEKDADTAAPIASMTKLMTAMVVLDAHLSPDEMIRIDRDDLDTLKHTRSGVPVGARFPRHALLEIALIASDNHAAAALARTYPGGLEAFLQAAQLKIGELQLENTGLVEPTGLSPLNHASAKDMVKILKAASGYPEIAHATSQARSKITVDGRGWVFRNTNGLVGKPGWDISVSKTGFTNEAGRCLTMRLESAGRKLLVVLMGAVAGSERALDAYNIQRFVGGEPPLKVLASAPRIKRVSYRAYRRH